MSVTHGPACSPQELKGRFLIKAKRLNKLEAIFAQEAAAADTDVTEEEESGDEDADEQEKKVEGNLYLLKPPETAPPRSFYSRFRPIFPSGEEEAEAGQRAVRHGDLLPERPLPRIRRRQEKPELLRDLVL